MTRCRIPGAVAFCLPLLLWIMTVMSMCMWPKTSMIMGVAIYHGKFAATKRHTSLPIICQSDFPNLSSKNQHLLYCIFIICQCLIKYRQQIFINLNSYNRLAAFARYCERPFRDLTQWPNHFLSVLTPHISYPGHGSIKKFDRSFFLKVEVIFFDYIYSI